jgi:hypothetical protein
MGIRQRNPLLVETLTIIPRRLRCEADKRSSKKGWVLESCGIVAIESCGSAAIESCGSAAIESCGSAAIESCGSAAI